jgi:hypothetical protein
MTLTEDTTQAARLVAFGLRQKLRPIESPTTWSGSAASVWDLPVCGSGKKCKRCHLDVTRTRPMAPASNWRPR